MLASFSAVQKVAVVELLEKGMYGTWSLMEREGVEVLKGKTRYDLRLCSYWLVKHGWYEMQDDDETRGKKYKQAASAASGWRPKKSG